MYVLLYGNANILPSRDDNKLYMTEKSESLQTDYDWITIQVYQVDNVYFEWK